MAENNTHIDVWSSSAIIYDASRPVPSITLVDILTQLAQMPRPHKVS